MGARGAALERAMLANANTYGVRIIGPNCLGIMRPAIGLNATFFKGRIKSGDLALVSQSGALCTAILDWAPATTSAFPVWCRWAPHPTWILARFSITSRPTCRPAVF